MQSESGSAEARTQRLQQYCVNFDELLIGFKILFGQWGPVEYQEVRRRATQDGHWPWRTGDMWPTAVELETMVGGSEPPIYPVDSSYRMIIDDLMTADEPEGNDWQPNDGQGSMQEETLDVPSVGFLSPELWFSGDGFGCHKIPYRKTELSKFILHGFINSQHTLFNSLTSVLNWKIGNQNSTYTIQAYLATFVTEKLCQPEHFQNVFDMHTMASLLNIDSSSASDLANNSTIAMVYHGAVSLQTSGDDTHRNIDDIIARFLECPLLLPITASGNHVPHITSSDQVLQIVFQSTRSDGSSSYRTIHRSSKHSHGGWLIKKAEWLFLDQQSLVPFTTLAHNHSELWAGASYAFFFSAPMTHQSTRQIVNSVISANFRVQITNHLRSFPTNAYPVVPHGGSSTRTRDTSFRQPHNAGDSQREVDDCVQDDRVEEVMGAPIRFIQNDCDEMIKLKAAIVSLTAGETSKRAGFEVPTGDDDNSTFRLPHRSFDDRVQGDPVQFLQAAFPFLLFCPDKGSAYYYKDQRGEYQQATKLTFAAFAQKLMQHVDLVPTRDLETKEIIGSRRLRPFCTDHWFVFFCYKRLMFQQLCSIRFTMNPSYRDNLAVDTFSELLDIQSISREQLQEALEALSQARNGRRANNSVSRELKEFIEKLLKSLDGFAGGVSGTPMQDTMTKYASFLFVIANLLLLDLIERLSQLIDEKRSQWSSLCPWRVSFASC